MKLRQTKFNVKKSEVGSLRLPEVMLVGGSEVELGKSTIPSSNKSDTDYPIISPKSIDYPILHPRNPPPPHPTGLSICSWPLDLHKVLKRNKDGDIEKIESLKKEELLPDILQTVKIL